MTAPASAALQQVPQHIAIIMDGNNRWAKQRLLPGVAGHRAGMESVRAVVESCAEAGVGVLTLFAFSSENWQRPPNEVKALMRLFLSALRREVGKLEENDIALRIIGERSRFSQKLQDEMRRAEARCARGKRLLLQIAVGYGGQWDICQAAQKLAQQVKDNRLAVADITPSRFQKALATGDLPAADLCIRTGGERRISNFLLWQLAYAELYFSDLLWPDFDKQAMQQALSCYANRERRFGRTSEQLTQ